MIEPFYYGADGIDLNTALPRQNKRYLTQWLGECHYQELQLM